MLSKFAIVKLNYFSNRVYETYGALVGACCDAWNDLIAEPARITSIAIREWAAVREWSRRFKTLIEWTLSVNGRVCSRTD